MNVVVSGRDLWVRAVFMLLFVFIWGVAEVVLGAVAVLQFLFVLLGKQLNENLLSFGRSLSRYIFQMAEFVTFNQEERPFPFSSWPSASD